MAVIEADLHKAFGNNLFRFRRCRKRDSWGLSVHPKRVSIQLVNQEINRVSLLGANE